MIKNSLGRTLSSEEPIFPLLSFDPKTSTWKCLGTGFFIHNFGGFVTAKHVFFDDDGKHVPTLYAVQTTESQERHLRVIRHFVAHPNADVGVGFLGQHRLVDGTNVKPEIATCFQIDTEPLSIGDQIRTFAFPLTTTELDEQENSFEFTFMGNWSGGIIKECHEEGFSLLRNKCYQTTMKIESGASGGPVLRNNLVVGVNSTGYDVSEDEEPISLISPIELIFDLAVPTGSTTKTIKMLIEEGYILAKDDSA